MRNVAAKGVVDHCKAHQGTEQVASCDNKRQENRRQTAQWLRQPCTELGFVCCMTGGGAAGAWLLCVMVL